ncbi:MAG: MFS transporter [Candidatus Acetothermia bacterium]|jgi:FSR family fosmidomycin resistance protein-like MFS transporter|nr:MFS transporter [Candidatus Acetothermia bacterium]MDH7504719.1 MFS transporter [Candidatus Acetothermia bacterium]
MARAKRMTGLVPLMVSHFTNDIYSNFLPAYIPQLIAKFSLSLTLAGGASSVYSSISSFTQLLFGYAGDRLGRANFALLAPLITAVFMSAVGLMPSYPLVLCLLVLAALGTASFHPSSASQAGGLSQHHKGMVVSSFIAAGSLGYALGPLLATGFIGVAGFERTYLLALPSLLLIAVLWRRTRWPAKPRPAERAKGSARALLPLLPLWLVVILRSTVQISFTTFLLVLLEQRGLSQLAGSLVLGLSLFVGTLGTLGGGYLSDRLGRRWVTALSLALAYPLYFGFLHTGGAASFSLLATGWALAAASNPVILTQAQELAPAQASMASAITMGFGWGIAGLLVSLVGWLADLRGLAASLNWTILALPLAAVVSLTTREQGRETGEPR